MHIPDGYLDWWICVAMYALSVIILSYAVKKIGKIADYKISMIGVVAAGIFAAQMLNWPIPGGTSAHFVGGALAGILLGPYAGMIAMASVITIQSLIFGDGGISALGANIFNMGIVAVLVGYSSYRALEKYSVNVAGFFSGWIGIWLAALICGIEIGISSIFAYKLGTTIIIMGTWHAVLGIIEGLATMAVVSYIKLYHSEIMPTEVSA